MLKPIKKITNINSTYCFSKKQDFIINKIDECNIPIDTLLTLKLYPFKVFYTNDLIYKVPDTLNLYLNFKNPISIKLYGKKIVFSIKNKESSSLFFPFLENDLSINDVYNIYEILSNQKLLNVYSKTSIYIYDDRNLNVINDFLSKNYKFKIY